MIIKKRKPLAEEIKNKQLEEINQYIDDIYAMRKEGLAQDGEYSIGNIVFKELRNKGYLDNLKDLKNQLVSKELSLESIQKESNESLEMTVDQDLSDNRQPVEDSNEVIYNEPFNYKKEIAKEKRLEAIQEGLSAEKMAQQEFDRLVAEKNDLDKKYDDLDNNFWSQAKVIEDIESNEKQLLKLIADWFDFLDLSALELSKEGLQELKKRADEYKIKNEDFNQDAVSMASTWDTIDRSGDFPFYAKKEAPRHPETKEPFDINNISEKEFVKNYSLIKLVQAILKATEGKLKASWSEDKDFIYIYRVDNPTLYVIITDKLVIDSYRYNHKGQQISSGFSYKNIDKALDFILTELELKDNLDERLEDKDRINYKNELSRLSHNQVVLQDNGLFHIYQVKEDDERGIINKLRQLPYIDWVQSSGGAFDFSTPLFGNLPKRYFTIYGKIKD